MSLTVSDCTSLIHVDQSMSRREALLGSPALTHLLGIVARTTGVRIGNGDLVKLVVPDGDANV